MRSPQRKLWELGTRDRQPVKRAKEETHLSPRWGLGCIALFSHSLRRGLHVYRPLCGLQQKRN